jgi:hypothetical protein
MNIRLQKLLLVLVITLFGTGYVKARLIHFDLAGLVEYSEIIAQGTLELTDCKENCIYWFHDTKIFKGALSKNEKIMICSFPYPDRQFDEWVDMSDFKREILIFVSKADEEKCYRPKNNGVFRINTLKDGTIYTEGVRGEPRRQKLKDFQDRIEKEVRKNTAGGAK